MPGDPSVGVLPGWVETAKVCLPGLGLAIIVAAGGLALAELIGGPGLLYVLLLGLLVGPLAQRVLEPSALAPGLGLAAKTVLRIGVMLLGLRIGVAELAALTPWHITATVLGSASTIAAGLLLARLLGMSFWFGLLAGGATAICGASAAIAIAAVLPNRPGQERETLFAILGVTTLSTVAMLIYPGIASALNLSPAAAGLFLGGSIHDVAQVIGAGFVLGDETGAMATLTKMLRVSLLAPLVLILGVTIRWRMQRSEEATGGGEASAARPPLLPWFLAGFLVLATLNSLGLVPPAVVAAGTKTAALLLVLAVAAIGLKTDFQGLRSLGLRGVTMMVGLTLWIAVVLLAAAAIS